MFPFVKPAFGLHPWNTFDRSPHWLGNLEYCIDHYGGFMGEIGLDRWIEHHDFDEQIDVFTKQFQLAAKKDIPASIHCLNAWGKLVELLEAEPKPSSGILLHSYSGSLELVPKLVELGVTFRLAATFCWIGRRKRERHFKRYRLNVYWSKRMHLFNHCQRIW